MLQRVDVLVLVDGEPAVRGAHGIGDVGAVGQRTRRDEQDVLEVEQAAGCLRVLVGHLQLGERCRIDREGAVGGGSTLADGGTGQEVDLGPLEVGRQVANRGGVGGQLAAAGRLGDQARLAREQLGEVAAAQTWPEEAELAQRRRVEGAHLHAVDAEGPQARPHLACGPGGEGDGQRAPRVVLAGGRPVRDAMGDGPGLARAGSGEHHDRPVQGLGDRALLVVEPGEDVGAGSHGPMLACRPDAQFKGLTRWRACHGTRLTAGRYPPQGRTRLRMPATSARLNVLVLATRLRMTSASPVLWLRPSACPSSWRMTACRLGLLVLTA